MGRFSPTEQIGVTAVGHIVFKELKWIFREQPICDMGIDAQIELVDERPTGKLIGVQIKAGPSHCCKGACGRTGPRVQKGQRRGDQARAVPVELSGHQVLKETAAEQ